MKNITVNEIIGIFNQYISGFCMRNFILIVTLLVCCQISSSFAQCVVSQTTTDQYTPSPVNIIGQAWVPECSGNLSKITVNVRSLPTNTSPYTLMVAEFSGSFYFQDVTPFTSTGVQSINITGSFPLTEGILYYFVLNTSNDPTFSLYFNSTNPYTVTMCDMFYSTTGTITQVPNRDLYFEIETTPFHIPTLPQWGLILMSVVFVAVGGRFVWKKV